MKLTYITNEYLNLLRQVSDSDGELTPEAESELKQRESDLQNNVDGIVGIIRQLEANAKECTEESKRLLALADEWDRKAKMCRDRLMDAMRRLNTDKIKTSRNVVTICNNGGKTPVTILPGAVVPDSFVIVKQVESTDMDTIRAKLEAGEKLSFATLGERGQHLRIK